MADIFDPSSISTPFNSRNSVTDLFSYPQSAPTDAPQHESSPKRRAACNECRSRKLKCSGQPEGCDRCVRQGLTCHYSEQKQMGRPRKKQKTSDESLQSSSSSEVSNGTTKAARLPKSAQRQEAHTIAPQIVPISSSHVDPSYAAIEHERTAFANICSGPIAQSIRDKMGSDNFEYQDTNGHQHSGLDDTSHDRPQYPLDISLWPDYSTLESLPLPLTLAHEQSTSPIKSSPHSTSLDTFSIQSQDPDLNLATLSALPIVPSCPCLANLYLTLSTISTLSSFPVSSQTINTLLAAQRTARDVIYCPVCPRKFLTGSQNLLLACTLLNALADQWHKVKNASMEDVKKGFTSTESLRGTNDFLSVKEGRAWRKYIQELIRAYVFGDGPVPVPPSDDLQLEPNIAEKMIAKEHVLIHIIESLGRRQRQWHNYDEPTDEFPDRCSEGYSYGERFGYHQLRHGIGKSAKAGGSSKGDNMTDSGYCKVHETNHHNSSSKKRKKNKEQKRRRRGKETEKDKAEVRNRNTGSTISKKPSDQEDEDSSYTNTSTNNRPKSTSNENDDHDNECSENSSGSESSEGSDSDDEDKAMKSHGDNAICLMMISYSMDIVKSLAGKIL